ncbi:MAG: hypothetical protein ACFE89_06790 [Candidatus Hodarchaeota archaeon]
MFCENREVGQATMASTFDALFNADYLPTKLLHRDLELNLLSKHFSPEENSDQSMNVLVHGSFGIGRTTLLRFFGQHEMKTFHQPLIRFQQKQHNEIVADALNALAPALPQSTSLPEQWTLVKRLLRKAEVPLLLTFDDVDHHTSELYGKFLQICKENGVSSMATAPRYFPRQLEAITSQFLDFSLELAPFSDYQFLDIVKQRVAEVYSNPVPIQITEFMSDLICLLDFQRPATVVDLLQNLHPLLCGPNLITADTIRQACINSSTLHYDFWSEHLSGLMELDVTTVLLLQAIGQYFVTNPGQIYVAKSALHSQFLQVSECIGLIPSSSQFSRALNTLLFQDLLLHSRYSSENYFTLLPATGYLDLVELLLGENQIEQ